MNYLIEIKNVEKSYLKVGTNFRGSRTKILKGVTFNIEAGSCVGLIGASGSGKSTLTRLIMGLEKPDAGEGHILIAGQPVKQWLKENRGEMSVVFQDYLSSVNPRYRVEEAIMEPVIKGKANFSLADILLKVGLDTSLKDRYPHELSGGQLQRVCIARAIVTNPRIIILDEAISSLDVSVQFQVLKLLDKLRIEMELTYLFVAHDLQAVTHLCNKIVFLNKGKIVEELESGELFRAQNAYVKRLLKSVIPFEI